MIRSLTAKTETPVRFSDVDSMAVVWHGQYVKYFEDAREAFGTRYGLHYLDVYNNGLMTPVVKLSLEYKKSLQYGDTAVTEINYIDCEPAKIQFEYKIYSKLTGDLVCIGESTQVFLNLKGELELTLPPFIINWKKTNGLLSE